MSLTLAEIEQVIAEITPALRGGWIQKIQQPDDLLLVLEIRVPGRTHRLLIACRPETARLHLVTHPPLNPPAPPAFCQFLRAHVQGARVEDMARHATDRIVEICLTSKAGPRRLICEFTGKRANLLLVDAEGRILRELRRQHNHVGQPYTPPSQANGPDDGPSTSRFSGRADGPFPVSAEIEAYYRKREVIQDRDGAKTARLKSLRITIKKEQRRIEAWRDDLARGRRYRDYGRYGELLKANLACIPKGAAQITVTDYFDETLPVVTIPLDPTKSVQNNMADYFRKHRKHQTAERELLPRIAQAERRLEELRRELSAIEQGTWTPSSPSPSSLRRLHAEATDHKGPRPRRSAGPFKRFTSTDGLPIYVGRNAQENEALTFGVANSDDLWLHARGTPGSHVVIRLNRGAEPPLETLRDAATLALLYSDLKRSGQGDVIYTRRKWVKKAKGRSPGAVTVSQERSLYVTLDKRRLDALNARSEPA